MCDLIDLNSPDVRGALESAKLASPLIPAPKSVECDDGTGSELATEKLEVDGNNPFDRVFHETAEYVSKKGDPFEMMLQRALRSKKWRNTQSVDFTDDFTPRKKKYFKTMNKTLGMLDESLLEGRFGLFDRDKKEAKVKTESVGINARNIDVCDSNAADNASVSKQEHKISVASPDSLELSILNQSAMNDALLEVLPKENGKASPFLEKDALFGELTFPSNIKHFKLPNIQRSLSQGAGKSPMGLLHQNKRSQSVTDGQRKISQSDNSTMSSFLNRGFLESRQSEQSVFSSLSNISSITKLTSASLSSSILSNDAMNHAFLDDGSSKTSQEKMSTTESSMEIKLRQYDLSDLAERLNKLKCTMNTTNVLSIMEDSNSMKEENNKQTTNNKLIDVDVFVPEQKEFNRSSSSTCSSDSVFVNTSKVDKSILNEAKVLAKTFEESVLKMDSGSSIDDDLISNNTLWMSELLPAFEDEPVVNDLIDLPVSPERNLKDIKNSDKKQSPASIDSTDENLFKKMESPLTDVTVVKENITSLLSDLRKLVKTESNPEAKKILDNLENILDINYKNNTELLVTCFNTSNKSQNLQKISSESIERFDKSSVDKSEEESDKITSEEKLFNEKSENYKLEDISQDTTSIEKSSVTSSSCKDNSEDHMSTTHSSDITEHNKHTKEKDNQVDKKVAVELLVNLQKLLSGQAEDNTVIQLLKNIGKALNTALNNNTENKIQANYTGKQNIQRTTPVRNLPESDRNVHSSTLSTKVGHRRSFEPNSKTVRRSVSAIESSLKSTSSTQVRRRRNTSELEKCQKRFSSDPGFINNLSNKKLAMSEPCNTRKVETARPDGKKEKSIAISDVKTKLKKRSDIVNKRGPLKAVHPVNNMQKKRASLGKQSFQVTTPPKSDKATPSGNKIISSTPNLTDNNHYMPKKPAKSKPIASSTPDGQNSKSALLTSANKKHNLSCDISPVTTYVNTSGSDEQKDSPKRTSKLPTPKKCTTPTRQQTDGIPRFLTPPRHSSKFNNLQSPQRLNRSSINFQRYSPISEKKNVGKSQQSPLKEINRITAKVKPLNLISKIKRHSIGDFTEKENNYM